MIDTYLIHKEIMLKILEGRLLPLPHYTKIGFEKKLGKIRADYVISNDSTCILEIKGCYRFKNERALFPDAITNRGVKQIYEMIKISKFYKVKSYLIFISPVPVKEIIIDQIIDANFYKAYLYGIKEGIEPIGIYLRFDGRDVYFGNKIKVIPSREKLP